MKTPSLHIRVLSDARPGHEIQSLSLATALQRLALENGLDEKDCSLAVHRFAIRQPWLSFCPRVLPRFGRNILWQDTAPKLAPPCDLLITCGRRAAAVGKWLKRAAQKTAGQAPHHVQILHPGDSPGRYDFLLLPAHDRRSQPPNPPQLLTFHGSLHPVNAHWLTTQRARWADRFGPLLKAQKPLAVLLIGNPGTAFFARLPALRQQLHNWQPTARWVVIGSPRTPATAKSQLARAFADAALLWRDERDGPNPYAGALAYGDAFAVTADSINMLNEACATGKPVLPLATEGLSAKHRRFVDSIQPAADPANTPHVSSCPSDVTAKTAKALWQALNADNGR